LLCIGSCAPARQNVAVSIRTLEDEGRKIVSLSYNHINEEIEFIRVPAGLLRYGAPADEWLYMLRPYYEMYQMDEFFIQKYETTIGAYQMFILDDGYDNPDYWRPEGWAWRQAEAIDLPYDWAATIYNAKYYWGEDYRQTPAYHLSYFEADAYANWLSSRTGEFVRIPLATQWEYVAEGETAHGERKLFPWGDAGATNTGDKTDAGMTNTGFNYGGDQFPSVARVEAIPTDTSWCGAVFMAGNVGEWTRSFPVEHRGADKLPADLLRGVKGGHFEMPPTWATSFMGTDRELANMSIAMMNYFRCSFSQSTNSDSYFGSYLGCRLVIELGMPEYMSYETDGQHRVRDQ
jgi:formylglycine-generating enzyme required for sulfatase activity